MKVNVLEFLPSIEDGGVSRVVANYCKYINKDKFNVSVLTLFKLVKENFYKSIVSSKCNVSSIFMSIKKWDISICVRVYKKLFSKKYITSKLKKYIKENDIKVLHVHLDVLQYVAVISDYLKKNNIKVFYTCHSNPIRWLGEGYFVENDAAKKLIRNNNLQILSLHEDMSKEINKLLNINNVMVMENFIDFSIFKNENSSKLEIKRKLGIDNNSYVIGNVCRFDYTKNLTFLIKVFKECYEIDKTSYLLLVCSGNQSIKNEIISKIKVFNLESRFKLLENVDNISEILKSMDVFCSTSIYEGFGISLLEAQLSGLNCVYSNVHPSVINLSEDNKILSLEDPKKWAKTIIDLKGKKHKIKSLIFNYDKDIVIKKIENLYSI